MANEDAGEGRLVLILAPAGRDAQSAAAVLERHGLGTRSVASVAELAALVDDRAGAVLITSEALYRADAQPLVDALHAQPTWSDLPFIYLAPPRVGSPQRLAMRGMLPRRISNAMVLERPLSSDSLTSAVDWALAARRRQFQVRDQIGELARQAEQLRLSEEALKQAQGALEERVIERTAALHAEMNERQRAQEALRQAQKMEAVGQLTGGIAHDFNNLLQGITGSLAVLQKRVEGGRTDDMGRYIGSAMKSAYRAAALTHRLLAFSRRQPLNPRPLQANPLVESMEELLVRTLGEGIALELRLDAGLWPTLSDANQLESAILNLAINARDAMPDGGRLVISTDNVRLDGRERGVALRPGEYVCICVTDSGTGMPPDVIERAFDPFFTTKPMGQGTGLGLSMIYGFARQSEGSCHISSELGLGTSVSLYLPRHQARDGHDELEAQDKAEPAPAASVPAPHSGEVVLVVEDDEVVRGLVAETLAELGFSVLQACDGPSGLEMLRSHRRIDLLVTDMGLPGLNGRQMADAARVQRPQLKVLF
ncbi:MAG: response regulator, partial [Aquabacterium sp.]